MIYATAISFEKGAVGKDPKGIEKIYLVSTANESWGFGKNSEQPFNNWYLKKDVYRWLYKYVEKGLKMKVITEPKPNLKPVGNGENDPKGYVRSEKNNTFVDNLENLPTDPYIYTPLKDN